VTLRMGAAAAISCGALCSCALLRNPLRPSVGSMSAGQQPEAPPGSGFGRPASASGAAEPPPEPPALPAAGDAQPAAGQPQAPHRQPCAGQPSLAIQVCARSGRRPHGPFQHLKRDHLHLCAARDEVHVSCLTNAVVCCIASVSCSTAWVRGGRILPCPIAGAARGPGGGAAAAAALLALWSGQAAVAAGCGGRYHPQHTGAHQNYHA